MVRMVRQKRLMLSFEWMVDFLKTGIRAVEVKNGLPKDTIIVAVYPVYDRRLFCAILESQYFDEIAEGAEIPLVALIPVYKQVKINPVLISKVG